MGTGPVATAHFTLPLERVGKFDKHVISSRFIHFWKRAKMGTRDDPSAPGLSFSVI